MDSRSDSCLWMKIVTIDDAENVILGLQDEIRRSEESRYDHRLHGVLLVAYGMNCCQVADLLGDAPRTVAYCSRGPRKFLQIHLSSTGCVGRLNIESAPLSVRNEGAGRA